MSPPTKAPPAPTLDRQVEAPAPTTGGAGADAAPAMAPPHAAVVRGQQAAGNQAMAAVLGGRRGIQRAPDDDAPDPRISGMAHAPTLDPRPSPAPNISSQTAVAPTLPAPPSRPPNVNSGMAHGPTLDPRPSPAPNIASQTALAPTQAPPGNLQLNTNTPISGMGNPAPPLQVNTNTPISGMGNPAPPVQVNTNTPISGMGNPAGPAPGGPAPGGPAAPMPGGGGTAGPARGAPGDPDFVRGGPLPQGGAVFPQREQWWQSDPRFAVGGEFGPKQVGPGQYGGRAQPVSVDPVPTPVNAQIVGPAYERDPSRVIRSPDMDYHQQAWGFSRGPQTHGNAPPPQAFTDGRFYYVAPDYPGKATELPGYAATGDVGLGKPGTGGGTGPGGGAGGAGTAPKIEAGGPAPTPPDKMRQAVAPNMPFTGEPKGTQKAKPATFSEVKAALDADPSKVVRSPNDRWHRQGYQVDGGGRYPPGAFKVGDLYVIGPDYPMKGVPKLGEQVPAKPSAILAAQTISPSGYVPQEGKPAKWDVKKGELSRQTEQEEVRTTDQGSDKKIKSNKTGYSVAKGATYERKQREETQTGDTFKANEKANKFSADLGGVKFNRENVKEYGSTPDGPKTKIEKNVGGGLGPDGLTGNASTAITSQSGLKAEAKGDVKLGPDGIALSGTGSITTPKGFTGHLSVSGKHNVVASDPKETAKGKFAVDFVMTDESGAEIGGGWQQQGGMGASVSVQAGSTTTNKAYETRVFDTKAEALIFQLTAAAQIGDPGASMKKATTADGAKAMKEGEVRGTSKADTDSIGGGVGMSQVSVGVAWSDTSTTGLKIQKMAGDKIRVTPSIAEQKAFNASISVGGKFGNTKGESETNSFAVTYEFDLGTPGGQKAFEKYCVQRLPPPMPPDAKWVDSTTGHQMEDHDIYKFAHIGEIGWGSQSVQETVQDETGIHTTAIGGQSEKVELNAFRKLTFDKNRHAEANIIGRMDNGQISQLAAHMTVGGEDGEFNRDQFKKLFSDKGAPAGTPVTNSGEWTLTADIDKKMFEELGQINDKMKNAKTREEKLKVYSELAQKNGPGMLMGQVRGSARKLAWNLELKGDANFPGAAGRAALNAQRSKLNAQLEEKPDTAGSVASEAKDAITSLTKRRTAVADKTKYTDLPDELRQEQVDVIDMHLAEFKSVRSRALSLQMRGGRQGDLVSFVRRVQDEHGYDDVKIGDRAWRKAQDLVAIHETVLSESEKEIAGLRGVVFKMIGATGDVRWGKGVHKQVYQNHNANVKQHIKTFRDQAPRLTEAVTKMRAQKEKWSAEPDPKERENLLREYDAYVLAALTVTDVQMQALRDAAGAAYAVAPDAAVNYAAALKVFESIKVDTTTRLNAAAGLDDDGSVIAN